LLASAREMAERNTNALHADAAAGRPIVFCEPSCLSAVREDAPALLRGETRRRAEQVAAVSVLFEEYAATLKGRLTLKPGPTSVLLHGHCHQKSMGLVGAARTMLSHIPGASVIDLDAGCCGMAGSFGYTHDHYDVSRAIGERKLFPAVRKKAEGSVVVAAGTSCRHQIADFTGEEAIHPAVLLESLLR
jgi:Fe-S oxidoreductase